MQRYLARQLEIGDLVCSMFYSILEMEICLDYNHCAIINTGIADVQVFCGLLDQL